MEISRGDFWKYEKPLFILKKRIWGGGYFYFPRKLARELRLDRDCVLLFRIASAKSLFCLSKISEVRKDYVLKISSDILKNLRIKTSSLLKLEFLQIKKRGDKPKLHIMKNHIDVIRYIPGGNEFVCFKRPGNWVTVYYLKGRSSSNLTIRRFVKLNQIFLWNIGFYLAEGEKATNYRFGSSNAEIDLIKLFRDCGEKCFGLSRNDWYAELRLKYGNEVAVKHWIDNLGLNKDKVNVRIVKNKPPETEFGNLSLVFYNRILGEINKNIIYDLKFIRNLSRVEKLYILRGLEAGDGTVLKNGCLEMGITCQKKEMEIVKYLLSSVCSKDPFIREYWTCDKVWFVFHRGIEMAKEYILDGHFLEHTNRRKRLLNLYKYYKFKELFCLCLLLNRKNTVWDLTKNMDLTYPAINVRLKNLTKDGFIINKKDKLFKNNRSYDIRRFYLTNKGKEYLNHFL